MKAAPLCQQFDNLHKNHGVVSRATCQRGSSRLRAEVTRFEDIANPRQYSTAIGPPHRLPPTDRRPQGGH